MTQQYLRKISVAVGVAGGPGIDFSNLRCVFTVRRGAEWPVSRGASGASRPTAVLVPVNLVST
jgi:hypothetical protein